MRRGTVHANDKHTVCDDGVRPADPLAIEGQDDTAVLVLVAGSHCGTSNRKRNKRMKSAVSAQSESPDRAQRSAGEEGAMEAKRGR